MLGIYPRLSIRQKRFAIYIYAKFPKDYKEFDFTHEDILQILEEAKLLQYLEILQISKPNKKHFSTEDAAQFFVDRHIEIRGNRIPFIRKAKRILTVTINDIHTDLADEELRSELYEYVANVSSIRHPGRNYKGMVFKDGYRQI